MTDTAPAVAPQATQQPTNQQVFMGENIAQGSQPQAQQNPQYIPYDRFKQVIDQRNQYQAELQKLATQQQGYTDTTPQSGINTVDDLLGLVEQKLDARLNKVYEEKLKPVESYVHATQFNANVERYFSDQSKAAVRQDMDAYTATLDPDTQQLLVKQIRSGNTQLLDAIYYQVAAQRGANVQTQTTQNVASMANMAQQPQPFRVIRQGEPTFDDIKQNALQTGNFKDVFKAMSPK